MDSVAADSKRYASQYSEYKINRPTMVDFDSFAKEGRVQAGSTLHPIA